MFGNAVYVGCSFLFDFVEVLKAHFWQDAAPTAEMSFASPKGSMLPNCTYFQGLEYIRNIHFY